MDLCVQPSELQKYACINLDYHIGTVYELLCSCGFIPVFSFLFNSMRYHSSYQYGKRVSDTFLFRIAACSGVYQCNYLFASFDGIGLDVCLEKGRVGGVMARVVPRYCS